MMEIIEKMYTYISKLEQKRFYQYSIGVLVFTALLMFAVIFQYYRTMWFLKSEIGRINDDREEVRTLLNKGQLVKREQREMDAIIAKDKNFKIAKYFKDILGKLGLGNKKASEIEVTSPSTEGKYQESILTAKFTGMTMKELTELLQELEINKRVFTKELEINSSQKTPNTIEVTLIIATLIIATLEPSPQEGIEMTE